MTATDLRALTAELIGETAKIVRVEPREIEILRSGQLPNRAGSQGQYFSTWDTAAGMLRDYSGRILFPILRLIRSQNFGPLLIKQMLDEVDPGFSRFLGYCGFGLVERYAEQLRGALDAETDVQSFADAFASYVGYVNRLDAWSFHFFPWHLGDAFLYPRIETREDPAPRDAGQVKDLLQHDGPRIRLTWRPLNVSVEATLSANHNPELCRDVLAALPFTILQDHAVVSGESIFAWSPLVTTAPVPTRELICDAPVGRLRFQQGTGQKIVVAYGTTTETLLAPVLGQVDAADVPKLAGVGLTVAESTFRSKSLIWLTVEPA